VLSHNKSYLIFRLGARTSESGSYPGAPTARRIKIYGGNGLIKEVWKWPARGKLAPKTVNILSRDQVLLRFKKASNFCPSSETTKWVHATT